MFFVIVGGVALYFLCMTLWLEAPWGMKWPEALFAGTLSGIAVTIYGISFFPVIRSDDWLGVSMAMLMGWSIYALLGIILSVVGIRPFAKNGR